MSESAIDRVARELARRYRGTSAARDRAQTIARRMRDLAVGLVDRFARIVREEGAPHLDLIHVGEVEPDDKSVRAFQVRLERGRFRALIVSKDRGEVMLVGPFKASGAQEPCQAIRLDEADLTGTAADDAVENLVLALIKASYEK